MDPLHYPVQVLKFLFHHRECLIAGCMSPNFRPRNRPEKGTIRILKLGQAEKPSTLIPTHVLSVEARVFGQRHTGTSTLYTYGCILDVRASEIMTVPSMIPPTPPAPCPPRRQPRTASFWRGFHPPSSHIKSLKSSSNPPNAKGCSSLLGTSLLAGIKAEENLPMPRACAVLSALSLITS